MLKKYYQNIDDFRINNLLKYKELIIRENEKLNLISRQDIINFEERHLLPCMAFYKIIEFKEGTTVLDVGSGGGLPGIPLSILFPNVEFTLVDSIAKKVNSLEIFVKELNLNNVRLKHIRVEQLKDEYDFIVGRAVTNLPDFMRWIYGKIKKENRNELSNGLLYLKGGELEGELQRKGIVPEKIYPLIDFYPEISFLDQKYIAYFKRDVLRKIKK